MTEIIPIITKHVAPHLKHRVTADGILADLDLCPIARFFSIPCEIEEQHDVGQFDDAEIEGWLTVRDIEVMVEARTPKAIDARSDETEGLGPQGESAVPQGGIRHETQGLIS